MKSLSVALDARTIFHSTRRGTGKNLIDLYRRVAKRRPDWTFLMFHRQAEVLDDPFKGLPNVHHHFIDMPGDRWNLWQHMRLPVAVATSGAAVLHAPANIAPRYTSVPQVVTIHDLIPIANAEWRAAVGRSAVGATHILTPSSFTRDSLVTEFAVAPDKITVNPWAPDTACQRVTDSERIDAARERYGLRRGQRYIFGFGAPDPRKNTERIIAAWAGLPAQTRLSLDLLLVGVDQEAALSRLRAYAASLAPAGGCHVQPFAPEGDVPVLLSGATALCYPSLSEGFGLPVLDAFRCGAPVIASDTTSLPEVVGDAGLLVDPTNVAAITDAMSRVSTSEAFAQELRVKGWNRVEQYSWDRCAETAAGVFEGAV